MQNSFEVVVIGGGIQGAGVAQAAAAAGYSTLLVEKSYWGAGTSSKSSKLIHGGLRYLENGQIPLVWQSLRERHTLLKLAPTLIKPCQFIVPIYQHSQRQAWQLQLGLSVYSLLAGNTPLARFQQFSATQIDDSKLLASPDSEGEKLIRRGLRKVFSYWDAQTDDRLLTAAVAQSAQDLGCETLCPATLLEAKRTDAGYVLQIDHRSDENNDNNPTRREISCQFLVNAAGPWINQVMDSIGPAPQQQPIELVKGSHLVLRNKISEHAFYLESPQDHRAVFALPWHGQTLLGTTEQAFSGDPAKARVSAEEEIYLLEVLSHYFPTITPEITERFAGLRVLPAGKSSAFRRPREAILHRDKEHPRLLALYGGKLTGYRHIAQQVAKQLQGKLGKRPAIADTATLALAIPQ